MKKQKDRKTEKIKPSIEEKQNDTVVSLQSRKSLLMMLSYPKSPIISSHQSK